MCKIVLYDNFEYNNCVGLLLKQNSWVKLVNMKRYKVLLITNDKVKIGYTLNIPFTRKKWNKQLEKMLLHFEENELLN